MEIENALLTSSTQADTAGSAVALGESGPPLGPFCPQRVNGPGAAFIHPNWVTRDLWCAALRSRRLCADLLIARLALLGAIDECLTCRLNNQVNLSSSRRKDGCESE